MISHNYDGVSLLLLDLSRKAKVQAHYRDARLPSVFPCASVRVALAPGQNTRATPRSKGQVSKLMLLSFRRGRGRQSRCQPELVDLAVLVEAQDVAQVAAVCRR